jgi:hypothetical protein
MTTYQSAAIKLISSAISRTFLAGPPHVRRSSRSHSERARRRTHARRSVTSLFGRLSRRPSIRTYRRVRARRSAMPPSRRPNRLSSSLARPLLLRRPVTAGRRTISSGPSPWSAPALRCTVCRLLTTKVPPALSASIGLRVGNAPSFGWQPIPAALPRTSLQTFSP